MPKKPLHICNKSGCKRLTSNRYCEMHKSLNYSYDKYRQSSSKRGYNSAWRKARQGFLNAHPFCAECLKNGIHTPATVVDHIKPHKGDKHLFWDKTNWQPLCKKCHDRKTVLHDGGFGNSWR